jgi:hypothetical protein
LFPVLIGHLVQPLPRDDRDLLRTQH